MHVFPGGAKASLVCKLSLESIAKTFKEHPKAPTPRRRVSAQFDISLRMVLHKSNQKHSLSYHQGLAYLNDVEASGQTYPPLNHWTNRTAAFPAFQLTSEATANCLQQSEASSRNDAKELQNAKSGCLKTTLHFLCTQNLAQTLSSGFHWRFLLKLVQLSCCWSHGQILRQGSRDITSQDCSEKKSVSMGTTIRSKQSERCERTAEREVSLLENNLALFVYSKHCSNFVLLISFTLFTHTRTTLKLFDKWVEHHQTKLLWKEMGVNEDNSPKQAVGTMRKNCGTRSLAAWKQPCTFCVLKKLCASFVLLISFTLFTHTRTTLKLFDKWVEHHQRKLLRKEMGINEEPGCFTLLPLSKESSSISQVKEAWRCGFVMLCTQRRFAFGMILPQEHIWQLVLATAPADWSWGLVLATGFLGKVQSQCSPEFCSAYIQEAAQQHSRVDNMPNFCKNSDWPTVPFLNLPCRQSCWKFVTHNAKHSTLDAGAFEIKDKAAGATKRAVTIMHKHISLLM